MLIAKNEIDREVRISRDQKEHTAALRLVVILILISINYRVESAHANSSKTRIEGLDRSREWRCGVQGRRLGHKPESQGVQWPKCNGTNLKHAHAGKPIHDTTNHPEHINPMIIVERAYERL